MMRSFRVIRSALWLLAEFCEGMKGAEAVLDMVKQCLGDLPLVGEEVKTNAKENVKETTTTPRQLVTSDGTYATQSAFSVNESVNNFTFLKNMSLKYADMIINLGEMELMVLVLRNCYVKESSKVTCFWEHV